MEQNKHYLRDSVLLLKLVFLFRVVILLDISVTNSMYIIHIQHSLRRLLEEQLSNKDCFNIIAYAALLLVGRSWALGRHRQAEASGRTTDVWAAGLLGGLSVYLI